MVKKIFVVLLVLLLIGNAHAGLTDGLVSYWNFDESSGNLIDQVGSNDGTNSNITYSQTGIIEDAYSFNGTSSKSDLGNGSDLKPTTALTMSAWIKTSTTGVIQYIVGNENQDTQTGANVRVSTDNKCQARVVIGGVTNYRTVTGTTTVTNNAWHHCVITYDGSNLRLYVNGSEEGTAVSVSNTITYTSSTPTIFGARSIGWGGNSTDWFNGLIDESGIWNRELTSGEIIELYNNGAGLTYPFINNSVDANFDYSLNYETMTATLTDTSTVFGDTEIVSWAWTLNGSALSTNQNTSFTFEELTDYNVGLFIDSNIDDVNSIIYKTISVGDLTPPETTFSSNQVSGTTDQNITLSCSDNDSGCKSINYNVNGEGWNSIDYHGDISIGYTNNTSVGTSSQSWVTIRTTDLNNIFQKNFLNSVIIRVCTGANLRISHIRVNFFYVDGTSTTSPTYSSASWCGGSPGYTQYTVTNFNSTKDLNYITYDAYIAGTSDSTNLKQESFSYTKDYSVNILPVNFLYSGSGDHNIQYYSVDNADNNESIKTSFFTTYGKAKFTFYDENSSTLLNDVEYTISTAINGDSGATLTDTNTLDLNLQGINPTTYTFTFSKTGYGTRYYTTTLNQFSEFDLNFALLPDTIGIPLTFQIRQPTTKTLVINTPITITKGNYTINKSSTDSEGYMTINLNPDQNTARYGLSFTFDGTDYDWNGTTVTIKTPKKETSPATSITPFEITINGISNYYIENKTTDQTIILWSDLRIQDNYVISIADWNATIYTARVYTRAYTGLQATDTIQPYLLTTEESTAVKFVIQDEYRANIPNVKIEVYKIIGGQNVMVSSVISDATGTGLFWLRAGDQYGITMYYNEQQVYTTTNYVVKSATTYFYLNLQSMTVYIPSLDLIHTSFDPLIDYLAPSVTNLKFTIMGDNVTHYYIQSFFRPDNNLYAPREYTYRGPIQACAGSCDGQVLITTLDTNYHIFYLELIIVSDDINFSVIKRYYKPNSPAMNLFVLFGNARTDFGCSTDPLVPCGLTMIVSIVLAIMIVGGLVYKFGIINPAGLIIIALAILGVLALVGWFYFPIYILMVIVGVIAVGKGLVE